MAEATPSPESNRPRRGRARTALLVVAAAVVALVLVGGLVVAVTRDDGSTKASAPSSSPAPGADPSRSSVRTPTISHRFENLVLMGLPNECRPVGCALGRVDVVNASAVAHVAVRHDAKLGWVVDVVLTPKATTKLVRDKTLSGTVGGRHVVVTPNGLAFTLSLVSWNEAKARAAAAAIAPS